MCNFCVFFYYRKMNTFLLVFLTVLLLQSSIMTGLKFWFEDENGWPDYVPEEDDKAQVNHSNYLKILFVNYVNLYFRKS